MNQILAITRKELQAYFSSLLAPIFLGTFLAAVLFIFFTIERFFGRGIADVRPMFQWMPVLLIFLMAALSMRQWSEEQRSGTLEVLLTLPANQIQLVLGKFFAVMIMMLIALGLTLPIPIIVSLLGNLDWGPVIGGYLAAILMSAAYAAIGLFISSRTDNQIVALILSVLIGGFFFIIGNATITGLFFGTIVDILRAIGTGSRFESIERGVIDLRDMVYYLSLSAIFLALNVLSLDGKRWSQSQVVYRWNHIRTFSLLTINLILVNVWLYPLQGLRLDLTQQKEFTVSQTTRDLVSNLTEPLLLRAYISESTHPLLTPLIPQIDDMLREYEIASRGSIQSELIDPISNPEIETEANQTYGVTPTPFQISGRNESSIINAYFSILVRYGDQSLVLSLQDLIDVSQTSTSVDVKLKNLEYSLTAAIKKVVYGFQSVDSVLASMENPVALTLLVSQSFLPEYEVEIANLINQVANDIQQKSSGKLIYQVVDPDIQGAVISRQELLDQYAVEPFPVSLFSQDSYFFHLLLKNGENTQVLYPPTEANEAEIRATIESALKRTSSGFLKVVGVWTPPQTPTQNMFGQTQEPISSYNAVINQIQQDYDVQSVDLSSGRVSDTIDSLIIIAPQNLTETEIFALDQYLMRGGSLILAVSPYKLDVDPFGGFLTMTPVTTGLEAMLQSYGIQIGSQLVMDNQNAAFPVLVTRNLGGTQVQEIQAVRYPFFVDVRPNKMDTTNMIVASLPTVSLNWPSPIVLDESISGSRDTQVLMQSSEQSWLVTDTNIQPDFETYPETGFAVGTDLKSLPLAVTTQGTFTSFFAGKAAPQVSITDPSTGTITETKPATSSVIEQSSESARLVVFASAAFIDDFPLQLSANLSQDYYTNNIQLMQNAVDWSMEDLDLLSIRSRGTSSRVLIPLDDQQRTTWEISTYIVEFIALIGVYGFWRSRRKNNKPLPLVQSVPLA
jgi:ABC-2 type transport system permease protein